MNPDRQAFAVWITGLPASGKSTVAAALRSQLASLGIRVAVLESDVMRTILSPDTGYQTDQRDSFYRRLVDLGLLLTRQGIPVVFDATANLRRYRDAARQQIPSFLEVYLECPLEVCMGRDPKGIYRKGRAGEVGDVPGLQATYEEPLRPEVTLHCGEGTPDDGARPIIAALRNLALIDR